MKSSMFLKNITVIDHAYIGRDGRQHGGSFHASFDVSGRVDANEQVVIDFSTVKKDIKAIVDDKVNGFDHKLWFLTSYSEGAVAISSSKEVTITTSALEITAPQDIIRMVEANDYDAAKIGKIIGAYVETELSKKHPGIDLKVECILNEEPIVKGYRVEMFRYSHGLRNSTSWGCQNIAHGHLSFLELYPGEGWRQDCLDCQQAADAIAANLTREWDGAVLIDEANVIEDCESYVAISYTTPRGKFYAKYRKPFCKVKILPHETTIEHIVEAFCAETGYWLERGHVGRIAISEGLSKGAYKGFDHDE